MAINDDIKITINLNELVEIRAKLLTQYEDYSKAVSTGEYLDGNDIDKIASCLLYTSPSPRDVEESRMPSSA